MKPYYEDEQVTGYGGDCVDVLKGLADNSIDAVVTDPPYGVGLAPTWRDGVYNGLGPAEQPYMRITAPGHTDDGAEAKVGRPGRTPGHRNTTLSGDTVVDWSPAFALVPSLEVAYVWHAGVHGLEVG